MSETIDPQEIRDAFEKIANELRPEIDRLKKRFDGCDIAAVKMSTVLKVDKLLNPKSESFDAVAHLRPRQEHMVLSTTCARLKELGRTPPTVASILFDERTVL